MGLAKVRVLTPMERELSAGIASFTIDGSIGHEVVDAVWQESRVVSRPLQLFNGVRLRASVPNPRA